MQDELPDTQTKRHRGIYILPNLFTTAALFAGFYAIVAAMNGRFEAAAASIFIAMVLDGLDGRVARMTNTQSEFGVQYDSLSDMVSFGIAPALVIYQWSLSGLGKLGWFAAFVYTAGTALRLARFNTRVGTVDKRYFQGLACPAAAAIVAGFIWVSVDKGIGGADAAPMALVLTVGAGLLMVSSILYRSFKDVDLKGRVPFVVAVVIMLGFGVVLLEPPGILFALAIGYGLSGPAVALVHWRRKRQQDRGSDADVGATESTAGDGDAPQEATDAKKTGSD